MVQTDPEILEALSRYRSVLKERPIATSGYYPKIGTELTAGPEFTDGIASNNNRVSLTAATATLYLRQNLYNGGKTAVFIKETDARILAAAYEVLNVTNRIFLETAEAYLHVLQAFEMLQLSEENVLTQEKILEQVREKTAAGFNRLSDLKNSEARLALARGNHISRQQDLNQAVVKFHRQYGRFMQPESFTTPEPVLNIPETVEETVAIAFQNHPALDVAKYNIQVRKYSFEKAKADYWPTLELELKAQHRSDTGGEEGKTDQASAMLKFNYTFYDGGIIRGEKEKNYEFLHKEYQRAYVERRNVNQTVRMAWNILKAEEQKKKYLADYAALSTETLETFKEEYHYGRRTLLDLLDMENENNSAEKANTESKYAYLIAYYRISQAIGTMLLEHDESLRQYMNLPSKQHFDLQGYEELDRNRDRDSVEDVDDQCDNSVYGIATPFSGCDENQPAAIGYQEPRNLSPYILPEKGTPNDLVLKIDKNAHTQSFHLSNITFNHNSAELTATSRKKLAVIADQLKNRTVLKLR